MNSFDCGSVNFMTKIAGPHLDLDIPVEQKTHKIYVFVFDGGYQCRPIQGVDTVNVQFFRLVLKFL